MSKQKEYSRQSGVRCLEVAGVKVKVCVCVCVCIHAQSCLTLCEPMDYSLPGSSVHGIF